MENKLAKVDKEVLHKAILHSAVLLVAERGRTGNRGDTEGHSPLYSEEEFPKTVVGILRFICDREKESDVTK